MLRIGIVAKLNMDGAAEDKDGRAYPPSYVWVRKLWMASPANPDPMTAHPIPVFVNRHHKEGHEGWDPLPIGTRVLLAKIDHTPLNREGWAVIGYGPQVDALFDDTRETAYYQNRVDNVDRIITQPEDPVTGPNEDYGRTHLDGEGMGWMSRRPYPDDPMRRFYQSAAGGVSVRMEHRLDESIVELLVTASGPARTYTWKLDAVNELATLSDDKGNYIELSSSDDTLNVYTLNEVNVSTDEGDVNVTSGGGNVTVTAAEGDVDVHAKGEVNITTEEGDINVTGASSMYITTAGSVWTTAAGDSVTWADGNAAVRAGGNVDVDGGAVNLGGAGGGVVARHGDAVQVVVTSGSSAGTYSGVILPRSGKVRST